MADPDSWLPRHVEAVVTRALAESPVVCLLGPRQCGKSALAQRHNASRPYFSFDDGTLRASAHADPLGFVAGLPPIVTLDEIQRVPDLLPAIKLHVDRNRAPGRFLLTGSADLLLLPGVTESLAGRLEVVRLHPLTEAEKERHAGGFLSRFLSGALAPRASAALPDLADLTRRMLQGGFPEAIRRQPSRTRQWHRDYVGALLQRDVKDVANLRNFAHLRSLLALVTNQTAQLLNVNALAAALGIRRETVENNLAALERLFIIHRVAAWHPNDTKRLVKTAKVHVVDSGLATTLSELSADDWSRERQRFGHLLESFVLQQLIAEATWTDPDLRFWHYRDKDLAEVDIVITRGRNVWGIEVKMGATVVDTDGRGLRRLAERTGRSFQGGVILYAGASTLPTAHPLVLAVPIKDLWSR